MLVSAAHVCVMDATAADNKKFTSVGLWGTAPLNIVCKLHTSHVTYHHEDVEPDAVVPLIFISSI